MYVLGIACYYHDSSAALLHDGVLIAAADEERFSRIKHDFAFPQKAIDFCLSQAGITVEDLDYVVFYEKPLLKFERILMTCLGEFPRSWKVFREAMIAWFNEKLWVKSQIMRACRIRPERILFVEHHLSHAASAFFCSPFEEAALLTVDGVGEWATTALGKGSASWKDGSRNSIELLQELRFPHSLGLLYSAFTAYLGFQVNEGEYKVMGMAPYGEPKYTEKVERLLNISSDGSFHLNMEYFSFHHSTHRTFNHRFVDLFGKPREPESDFFTLKTDPSATGEALRQNQYYADIASSVQKVTEEVLLKMANEAYRKTGLKRLCLAGGVALNSVANGRILRETPFEEVYIQPAAGDSGGSLGAALYAYHVMLQKPRRFVMEHAYWGKSYSAEEELNALREKNLTAIPIQDEEKLSDHVVEALLQGKVIGLSQGRFEWGPRALGNRSILADPRRDEMKEIVNTKIKFREPFRPFAPVVLEERVSDFFDVSTTSKQYPARYMLLVANVHEQKRNDIAAVTHVDGTGRVQTLRREWNPRYYRFIEKFGEATGVPVLLNTSFNLRGEPMVNTPQNAINTYLKSDIDILVLGSYLTAKQK